MNKTLDDSNWVEQFSKSRNVPYWFNTVTRESVWVKPTSKRPREDNAIEDVDGQNVTKAKVMINSFEDFPQIAIEREELRKKCLDVLISENLKYGEMKGRTKTAISCRNEGMHIGMLGIFARIMWHQLLCRAVNVGDVGGGNVPILDGIFVNESVSDENVEKEFINGGRTAAQTKDIMRAVHSAMETASRYLISLRSTIDQNIAVTLKKSSSSDMFQLSCQETSFTISNKHLHKILNLYRLHTDADATLDSPLFLRRLFCVIARYETLSGTTDGYQMAFPDFGFEWLRQKFNVKIECFASPLNCWNQRFCSVARDTDHFFGSLGNFFLFQGSTGRLTSDDEGLALGGSFEANPPFVESIMNQMAQRIEYLLDKYRSSDAPFSFVVIVPAWYDCEGIVAMTNSPFLRPPGYRLLLERKKHAYRPGMQHRTGHEEQPSNVDTLVFFLQNDEGARRWPVNVADCDDFKTILQQLTY